MSDTRNQPLRKSEVTTQISLSEILFSERAAEPSVLSIEQLNVQIKQLLEGQIGQVWVRGEISNFKAHTSGHFYFSLKDSKSQITAVMFRGHNSRLKFKPVDGMEVLVRARVSVYEPRGNYQLMCEMMEPVGAGALQKAFEQLKAKLKAEGLFEASRKRTLPHFPGHIAIVTSPTGAAIRDMMNVLSRRAKNIQITVVPTIVQGEGAAPQIIEAFKKAIALPDVDVIIIGRGGGSIEDMWCFNDEELARQIAASPIPVISAVGHEIDFTIA
ncbi:MAG TPA: exodeoxyribonuclease VII large subunit, partial [Bdellovibrio sp.]|nr:exodeoxyribonuclease VII large subunit [Bdellovibrio sp.]